MDPRHGEERVLVVGATRGTGAEIVKRLLRDGFSGSRTRTRHSMASIALNLIKGRTLVWRRRAEDEIRCSSLDYTIIRCGVLRNEPAGRHAIDTSQRNSPMAFWRRIGRADAAEVFVQALQHPATRRTTFDATWSRGEGPSDWDDLFSRLRPDPGRGT